MTSSISGSLRESAYASKAALNKMVGDLSQATHAQNLDFCLVDPAGSQRYGAHLRRMILRPSRPVQFFLC